MLQTTSWAADAAAVLRSDGFYVLPASTRISKPVVSAAQQAVHSRLAELLDAVKQSEHDAEEQAYSFREICHRQRLRWDVRMPGDCSAWQTLCDSALEQATPLLRALCPEPRVLMSGAVVSRPGAVAQGFHTDGLEPDSDNLLNIFVPLVDLAGDGTQFWPASHERESFGTRSRCLAFEREKALALESDASALSQMVAPACRAGELLCFTYDVYHRGLPNQTGRERAMAYIVVGLSPSAADNANFPAASVFDALPAHATVTPWWHEYE